MRKVLDIIDGVNIMEFNTPRSSDGDLFRIGDNNLDFYTNIDMDIYGIYSLYLYREDFGDLEDNKIDNFYPNFTIGNRTIICGNVT